MLLNHCNIPTNLEQKNDGKKQKRNYHFQQPRFQLKLPLWALIHNAPYLEADCRNALMHNRGGYRTIWYANRLYM